MNASHMTQAHALWHKLIADPLQLNLVNQMFKLTWWRKDLQALSFVGLTRDNPVLDPPAVLHLDNRLNI